MTVVDTSTGRILKVDDLSSGFVDGLTDDCGDLLMDPQKITRKQKYNDSKFKYYVMLLITTHFLPISDVINHHL